MIKNCWLFLKQNFIKIFVTVFFICLILYKLNFNVFVKTITNFDYKYLLLFIPIYLINQFLKGYRLNFLLNNQLRVSDSFYTIITGNLLNICLPSRFGDIWKIFYLSKYLNITKINTFGTIISERFLDLVSIVPFFIFVVLKYFRNNTSVQLLNITLIMTFTILVMVFCLLFLSKKTNIKFLKNLSEGIRSFKSLTNFILSFSISLLVRIIESIMIYLLILGSDLSIGVSASLFVMVFNAISGMIPSISTYIGAYQYSYIYALSIYNVSAEISLAIVIIYEFITLFLLSVIGFRFFIDNFNVYKSCKH